VTIIPQIKEINTGYGSSRGAPKRRLPGCSPPQNPTTEIKKKTDVIDIVISNVLRDLSFSRNQPLKSADD
jgi:hypothetical protein